MIDLFKSIMTDYKTDTWNYINFSSDTHAVFLIFTSSDFFVLSYDRTSHNLQCRNTKGDLIFLLRITEDSSIEEVESYIIALSNCVKRYSTRCPVEISNTNILKALIQNFKLNSLKLGKIGLYVYFDFKNKTYYLKLIQKREGREAHYLLGGKNSVGNLNFFDHSTKAITNKIIETIPKLD